MADKIQIEERVELLNKLKAIKSLGNNDLLPVAMRQSTVDEIKILLILIMKGILCKYYLRIRDLQAYQNINI